MKNAVFWDVAPCRSCVNRRLEERIASIFKVEKSTSEEPAWAGCCRLPGSSLTEFSTLKMEAIRSSETSVHTRSTRHHVPKDCILQNQISFHESAYQKTGCIGLVSCFLLVHYRLIRITELPVFPRNYESYDRPSTVRACLKQYVRHLHRQISAILKKKISSW
jgi:hypothetical protein